MASSEAFQRWIERAPRGTEGQTLSFDRKIKYDGNGVFGRAVWLVKRRKVSFILWIYQSHSCNGFMIEVGAESGLVGDSEETTESETSSSRSKVHQRFEIGICGSELRTFSKSSILRRNRVTKSFNARKWDRVTTSTTNTRHKNSCISTSHAHVYAPPFHCYSYDVCIC